MVRKTRFFAPVFVLFFLLVLFAPLRPCLAQVMYKIDREWVQITINKDRSIYLFYNITIMYTFGSPEGIVTVGLPQGGFQIISVQDNSGNSLSYEDVSSGDYYAVEPSRCTPLCRRCFTKTPQTQDTGGCSSTPPPSPTRPG